MPRPTGSTLLVRTRTLLLNTERPLLDIHRESGLPFYWLRKVKSGEIRDPSVSRTQRLYEYLTNRKLSV